MWLFMINISHMCQIMIHIFIFYIQILPLAHKNRDFCRAIGVFFYFYLNIPVRFAPSWNILFNTPNKFHIVPTQPCICSLFILLVKYIFLFIGLWRSKFLVFEIDEGMIYVIVGKKILFTAVCRHQGPYATGRHLRGRPSKHQFFTANILTFSSRRQNSLFHVLDDHRMAS